jgi:hypothetical protein
MPRRLRFKIIANVPSDGVPTNPMISIMTAFNLTQNKQGFLI